jgi:hypothetical protein
VTPNYALKRTVTGWKLCAAGTQNIFAPAVHSNGRRAAAQRGRWTALGVEVTNAPR